MSSVAPTVSSQGWFQTDAAAQLTPIPSKTDSAQENFPLYLAGSGSGHRQFELLGMPLPQANGDIAALLAKVSLNLEKSISQGRNNRLVASFAGLASMLASDDLEGTYQELQNRKKTLDDASATREEINARAAPLLQGRDALNVEIDGYRGDMAFLQAALANPDLVEAQREVLEGQLAAAQSGLADALDARQVTDVALANVRIDGLDMQIDDLEAQLSAMPADSPEADTVRNQIATLSDEVDSARAELAGFEAGPKSDATLTAFSEANLEAFQSSLNRLDERIIDYQAAYAEQSSVFENTTILAIAAVARAVANFQMLHDSRTDADAGRDSAVEHSFEIVSENADDAGKAISLALKSRDLNDDARLKTIRAEDEKLDRIRQLAQAIVLSLGDLANTLSQLESTDLPTDAPPAIVNNRVRLDI